MTDIAADENALRRIPDLPPAVIRRQGDAILTELRHANREVSDGRVDYTQSKAPVPPDPRALKALSGIVGEKARELGIATELLSTKRDLAALLRGERDVRVLSGWRRNVIGEPLLAAL